MSSPDIKKTRISSLAYPLSEVLRKPKVSNKQCRNPRSVYTYTRVHKTWYTQVYNTPHEHLLQLCFRRLLIEISQVSESQKQALVNAIQYVCNPTLAYLRRHPKREFALQSYNYFLIYANNSAFCEEKILNNPLEE